MDWGLDRELQEGVMSGWAVCDRLTRKEGGFDLILQRSLDCVPDRSNECHYLGFLGAECLD